jgi:hypothetical protein
MCVWVGCGEGVEQIMVLASRSRGVERGFWLHVVVWCGEESGLWVGSLSTDDIGMWGEEGESEGTTNTAEFTPSSYGRGKT